MWDYVCPRSGVSTAVGGSAPPPCPDGHDLGEVYVAGACAGAWSDAFAGGLGLAGQVACDSHGPARTGAKGCRHDLSWRSRSTDLEWRYG
jgi:hypothetical protein